MKDSKKVLFIFFRPPFPLLGGDKIRMFQKLKTLSKIYDVDVLFLNEEKTQPYIISEIKKWAQNVYPFEMHKNRFRFNTLKGFFLNKKPLQVNYFYHKKVQDWVDKNIIRYNAVFCSTIRTTEYVIDKPVHKIVDFVDAISMNYEKAAKNKKMGIWKIMYLIDKKRLLKYERKIVQSFDKRIIISNIDRKHILRHDNERDIKVIPNSVEKVEIKVNKNVKEQNAICFIGKMDYEPNRSAVLYFANKILPYVLQKHPDVKFNIIGVNPTKEVKKLTKYKAINVLGYVEHMNPLIIASKLVVAPMISGAGIQNKILQSMALKKAVITTTIGAEGLIGVTDKEISIEDNNIKMADRISQLLGNKKARDIMGSNAKKYVDELFSEQKIETELLKYLSN